MDGRAGAVAEADDEGAALEDGMGAGAGVAKFATFLCTRSDHSGLARGAGEPTSCCWFVGARFLPLAVVPRLDLPFPVGCADWPEA